MLVHGHVRTDAAREDKLSQNFCSRLGTAEQAIFRGSHPKPLFEELPVQDQQWQGIHTTHKGWSINS